MPGEKKRKHYHRLANGITFARLILIPFFIGTVLKELYWYALIFVILIILSDILDGIMAKKSLDFQLFGALFDLATDFIFVLAGFLIFYWYKDLPFLLLILSLFSFLSFCAISFLQKMIFFGRVGKYSGGVCYATITCIILSKIIDMRHTFLLCVYIFNAVFLSVSVLEMGLMFFLERKRPKA